MTTPFSVNLSVANLDTAMAWYRDVLGFEQVYRKPYPEKQLEIAFLHRGDFRIEIIQFNASAPGPRFQDPPRHAAMQGITHFAVRVPDLVEAIARLAEQQVPLVWGPTHFDELKMSVVFLRDPDGNLVKLVELAKDSVLGS